MTDRIRVAGLRCDAVIGIYGWERRVRQRIVVDVGIEADLSAAAATDRIGETPDYKELTGRLRDRVRSSRYRLLEALAYDLAEMCLEDPRVLAAEIALHKPGALRHATDVVVSVTRRRADPPWRPPHRAYVGIGSNLDAERHVRFALARLAERFGAIRVSPVYRTRAVGMAEPAPDFLNLAVELHTDLGPRELVAWMHSVETEAGRTRGGERLLSRELDLDLLLWDDRADPGPPALPHRLLAHAPYVLVPMSDLAPGLRHPVEGVPLSELRARLPERPPGVEPYEDDPLW